MTALWTEIEEGSEWKLGQFTIYKQSAKCYRLEGNLQFINNFKTFQDAKDKAWIVGGF